MIIVAVDDLLFSSKIRETARHAGAELMFARTPDAVLREARERRPPLVIFDLNADRIQPIPTIQALRQDPDLAGIRLVGFVSHVRTDIIEAARAAGAEVMPRSRFVAELEQLLTGARGLGQEA